MDDEPALHPVVEETVADIASMEVRGAAAIALAAADALSTAATESDAEGDALRAELRAAARALHDTRPTAISLANAIRRVLGGLEGGPEGLAPWVAERAATFREELAAAQDAVGRVGGNRVSDGDVVMTHCHSTAAMACVEHAVDDGTAFSAIVKETRPRMQGHETARHLDELGVDATLIVDGAAHRALRDVDLVLVGADSISADGTLVNKVGTAGLAASAAVRDVPVVVAASTIKLNPETLAGEVVPIEERVAEEVVDPATRAEIGDPDVRNPAFDRTPPRHLAAVATEEGLLAPGSVGSLLRERYGAEPPRPWAE